MMGVQDGLLRGSYLRDCRKFGRGTVQGVVGAWRALGLAGFGGVGGVGVTGEVFLYS